MNPSRKWQHMKSAPTKAAQRAALTGVLCARPDPAALRDSERDSLARSYGMTRAEIDRAIADEMLRRATSPGVA